jgi:hypothetical protein
MLAMQALYCLSHFAKPFFVLGSFEMESCSLLGLALNCDPPGPCLLSSSDLGCEPPVLNMQEDLLSLRLPSFIYISAHGKGKVVSELLCLTKGVGLNWWQY